MSSLISPELPADFVPDQTAEILEDCPSFSNDQSFAVFALLHGCQPAQQKEHFLANGLASLFFESLGGLKSEKALNYVLLSVVELARCDNSLYPNLLQAFEASQGWPAYIQFLNSSTNVFLVDKATFLLSSLMAYGDEAFGTDKVAYLLEALLRPSLNVSPLGRLSCLCNLLKTQHRWQVWEHPGCQELIFKALESSSSLVVYKGLFALWIISQEGEALAPCLVDRQLATKLGQIFGETEHVLEKNVRIGVSLIERLLIVDVLADSLVEHGIVEHFERLELRKWQDPALNSLLIHLVKTLHERIVHCTSYQRYIQELKKGVLRPSFMHSDKSWVQLAKKMEPEGLTLLVNLIISSETDELSLVTALQDVDRFLSNSRTARKDLEKSNLKTRLLFLLSSENSSPMVHQKALLCYQKLILSKSHH